MIDPSSILEPRDDIRYRVIDGEAVVVQQTDARVMSLNPLGTRLLTALDGRTRVGDILHRLAPQYAVAPEVFEADALRYLDALHAAHVVRTPAAAAD